MELLTSVGAARRLGVTTTTIKRWADAGILRCERTVGGHRRFRAEDVDRAARATRVEGPLDRWIERLLRDPDRALHATLLAERQRRGSWWRVADALGAVLRNVGVAWEEGRMCVADEHLASNRLSRALARICESIPVRPEGDRVLLAAAEQEDHTLGLSLVEICLREHGCRPVWFGARTPAADLAAMIRRGEAEGVAISASVASEAAPLEWEARVVGEAAREAGAWVVVGGMGPWPDPMPHGARLRSFRALDEWLTRRQTPPATRGREAH